MIVDPATFTVWADMYSRVLRRAPELPTFRILDALQEAAGKFFEDSRVWRTSRGLLLTTAASTLNYTYTAPTNAQVHAVFSAWDDDEELDVIMPGDEYDADQTETTDTFKVGARPINILYLSQLPTTASNAINGVLILKPSAAAVGIPTDAWNMWGEDIACGAAAMVVTESDKPWSRPGTHQFLLGQFADAISSASMAAGPSCRKSLRSKSV
jgi:hypothetical protein